ncbi:MAG TPA: RNB domain-containing ribonuclease [Abditibacteriaceae bacterium]|jgi:exoribonuclease-2
MRHHSHQSESSQHRDPTSNPHSGIDLHGRAERAVREAGFKTEFTPEAMQEAANFDVATPHLPDVVDLRELLWSSIDNEESRDLDQVEYCQRLDNEHILVRVGIADVASRVLVGSAIDRHAEWNTCSIYTGVQTFPMLPERLSTDLTSLVEGEDRLAVVIDLTVDQRGEIVGTKVCRAQVRNQAKLVYETIGDWLDGQTPVPSEVTRIAGLEEQLRLQWEVATRLLEQRQRNGALDVEPREVRPVVVNGKVIDLVVPHKNVARLIIENFMVSINMALAQFLKSKHLPVIQRVVREPERWPRIVELAHPYGVTLPPQPDARALSAFLSAQRRAAPQQFADLSLSVVKLLGRGEYVVVQGAQDKGGHFGLGMHHYAHSTAPNRRFPDLVTQRIVQAAISGAALPYSVDELASIAAHCTEREAAAQKAERLMRKVEAATLFGDRIGQIFTAVVTGASRKGTYVRTAAPAVEGRLSCGERDFDVGDRVQVRLTSTNPERGFIDFSCA